MKTQRVAHLLCHLLVLFPAASFAPSRGPRPSTCLRKKGGVEFEDFSSVGTVPAAARELSGALAEEQRDMAVISPLVNALPQWANVPPGEDVRFALLRGDWKLSFVRNVDTFSIVGTGLHKVALTRMEELFMSFSGKRKFRTVLTTEILRVIGPFPNVKNELTGDVELTSSQLKITYTSMVDGTGKVVDGKDQTRTVALWVRHADPNLLVLEAAKGTAGGVGSDDVGSGEVLVFERTLELADELKKLRVVADDAPTLSMPKMPKLPDGIPSLPKLPSLPDSFKGPFN